MEFTNGIFNAAGSIYKSNRGSILRTIVYTIGHFAIAITVLMLVADVSFAISLTDAIVEPMRLFNDVAEDASNQRPDIFLRNPRGLGRQVIIDVIRKSEREELGSEANTKAVLEDLGHNADLYIAYQEDNTQN